MIQMITVYQLKASFQNLLCPLVKMLAGAGVTANQITLAALLLSLFFGLLLYLSNFTQWALFCLPLVLFVRMSLNAVDGMLAKEHNMKSPLGAVLNELSDVFSDAALYLPFAALPEINPFFLICFVIIAIISEMTGVIGVQIGASRRYDGPMGKSDRALVFGILAFVMGIGLQPGRWFDIAMCILLLLCILTIINRVQSALKEIQ